MRRHICAALWLVAAIALPPLRPAAAQSATDWPQRPIRVVVPSAAGGYDSYVRMMAPFLAARLGQNVVVESKPGAAGSIGMAEVKRTAPDGYTVLFAASNAMVINSSVQKAMPVDPIADFDPVAIPVTSPMLWTANPDSSIKSLADLIAAARAAPGKIDYANTGLGTMNQLIVESFKQRHKLDIVTITFNGTPPAQNEVIAGRIPVMVDSLGVAMGHIGEGRVRPLAVTTRTRAPKLPDVPTTLELGLEDREFMGWYAFSVPKGTPPAIVAKLNAAINEVIREPLIAERIAALGARSQDTRPQDLTAFMVDEREKFRLVVQAAGLQPQ